MGRELKRKQAKIEGRNVREVQKVKQERSELKPKTLLVILGFMIGFFVILYLVTGLFITKDIKWLSKDKSSSDSEEVTSIENKILASESLSQKDDTYYVYFYDTSNEDSDITNTLYLINDKVYRVDLHDGFNSNYVGEPSGVVDDVKDLKVSDPTVIKVSSGKIVDFYAGKDKIKSSIGE